jgi:hypothetical protein
MARLIGGWIAASLLACTLLTGCGNPKPPPQAAETKKPAAEPERDLVQPALQNLEGRFTYMVNAAERQSRALYWAKRDEEKFREVMAWSYSSFEREPDPSSCLQKRLDDPATRERAIAAKDGCLIRLKEKLAAEEAKLAKANETDPDSEATAGIAGRVRELKRQVAHVEKMAPATAAKADGKTPPAVIPKVD